MSTRQIGIAFILTANLILSSGCTIHHQGRLYDMNTGNVIALEFQIKGHRAINQAVLPSGERCHGESVSGGDGFITVGGTQSSWGSLYGYGNSSYSSVSVPFSQRGVCVLVCENAITIECEYRVMTFAIRGDGICRDNRGKYYRLMF